MKMSINWRGSASRSKSGVRNCNAMTGDTLDNLSLSAFTVKNAACLNGVRLPDA